MSRSTTRRTFLISAAGFAALLCTISALPAAAQDEWKDEIGYGRLSLMLGDDLPTGAGVPISLVEAQAANSEEGSPKYYFDTTHSQFSAVLDPDDTAITIIDGSGGQSNGNSGHAFDQARTFFGNTSSVAPEANEVTIYEANDYLTDILNFSGNSTAPDPQDFRVQNFAWVGTFTTSGGSEDDDRKALRKFDFVIDRDNITAVVGVNNGTGLLPHLLSHSYNAISVGKSDGIHSTGLTRLADYGVGRSKPELVAPRTSTSLATSSVSSVATFLHSASTVVGTDAENSEAIKAILLAGASKDAVASWSQLDGTGTWHPLDDTYGAGEVNIYDSYAITAGGQFAGTTGSGVEVTPYGWDFQSVQPGDGNELLYDFVIPEGSTAEELSIALTWNAEVSAPFNTGEPVLANLNLELVDSNGVTVDTDLLDTFVDGISASTVDNVEHIYLTDLAAGTYTLKVSSEDLASEFGLAWRTATVFDTLTADFDADGDVDGKDFLTWQGGYGTIVNAGLADGDADGDGDVDIDDLTVLHTQIAATNPALAATLFSVPEPSTLLLAASGILLLSGRRRFQRCD